MALNVHNKGSIQLSFTPSAEVADASSKVVGAVPATKLEFTAEQILNTRTTVLTGDNSPAGIAQKRQEILDYFHQTYSCYEKLFEVIRTHEAYYMRPDALRHPLIFYYGHTAVLYINKLIAGQVISDRVNEKYESMLAVGVDEMSWDDLNDSNYDWPSVPDVKAYRDVVRVLVDRLIRTMPLQLPITWQSPWWVIMLGIEHERIHLETSSVLIRQLPVHHVVDHPLWPVCQDAGRALPENPLLPVPERAFDLAKPYDHFLYGWDNEYGSHPVQVPGFKASQFLVSNREFLAFVQAGCYSDRQWWTDEGWRWKQYRQATHPLFWVPQPENADEPWSLRQMTHVGLMRWDWPVEVNYLEAKAFCNWKSKQTGQNLRLPTEEEWASLRLHVLPLSEEQPFWKQAPGNLNLEHWASSTPIDAYKFAHGFYDVMGNVWQWTETPIDEFNGFRVHPVYDDFSVPTFDTRHNMIKGGSWISTGNEATFHSRYAFRRHFFQHAGFRYVESDAELSYRPDLFERDPKVAVSLESHYGPAHLGVPNFQQAIAELVSSRCQQLGKARARVLDMGCAAGRTTFELAARGFEYALGLDLSTRFFRLAVELKARGAVDYALPEEGDRVAEVSRKLSESAPHLNADHLQRSEFLQADACNLDPRYKGFDVVLAANLLEHIAYPRRFLQEIPSRINAGGLLVIASTFAWDAAVTAREEWLGGQSGGNASTSADVLRALLTADGQFRELSDLTTEVPFVIREQARKYQHGVSQVLFFEKL